MRFRFPRGDGWTPGVPKHSHTYAGSTITAVAPYQERDGARLVYYASKFWLLGGWWPYDNPEWGLDVTTNGVWSSPDLVAWTQNLTHVSAPPTSGAGARWRRRHTFGCHVWNGAIWVVGSDASDGSPWLSDVWSSTDPGNANGWTRIAASSPWGPKYLPMQAIYGGALHVMGGYHFDTSEACAEHWRTYDGATWDRLPDVPFSRAAVFDPMVIGSKLVIAGGSSGPAGSRTLHNDTWAWNGSTWKHMSTSAPWSPRDWITTRTYDGRLWAATGASPANAGGVYWSDDLGRTWTAATAPWLASHADASCVTDTHGIVIATGNGQGQNVYRLWAA